MRCRRVRAVMRYFSHTFRPRFPQLCTLIESIRRFDTESPMTVVCPDENASDLRKLIGDDAEVVTMSFVAFECGDNLPWPKVAAYRSQKQVAWTMQGCLPWWMMQRYTDDSLFYVDDDCFYFAPLQPYIKAIPKEAIAGVCRHHFPAGKENIGAGTYNNGMCWFRNCLDGSLHARAYGEWSIDVFEPHEQKHLAVANGQISLSDSFLA